MQCAGKAPKNLKTSFMETITKTIEVDRSLRTVYNQWTQFEDFPRFMEGIKAVRQLDDKRLHWEAEIAGQTKSWDAEIFEQVPDKVIAWRSTSGAENSGTVEFKAVHPGRTKITLTLAYDPQGFVENFGDMMGLVSARVSGDLKRFETYIEEKSPPPQGWRGEIDSGQVQQRSPERVHISGP
jgi:uncharacterized membrane protein